MKRNQLSFVGFLGVAACLSVCVAAGFGAQSVTTSVVLPSEELIFPPPMPYGTATVTTALLRQESSGGGSALVKMTKGCSDRHSHPEDQEYLVVKGTMTLWEDGREKLRSKLLHPGSYWYETRGLVHQNTCLSDECILFVHASEVGEPVAQVRSE